MRLRLAWTLRWSPYRCVIFLLMALMCVPVVFMVVAVLIMLSRNSTHQQSEASSSVDFVYFDEQGANQVLSKPVPSIMETLEAGAKRMASRRRQLSDACTALLAEQHLGSREFIISEQPALVFCPVFRAASSSWLANMLTFRGAKIPITCGRVSRERTSPPMDYVRKFYPRPSASKLTRALATSPSLLIVRHPLDRLLSAFRDAAAEEKVPDFPGFARTLLTDKTALSDPRWAPIANFCTPCAAEFSYIMKVETLAADQKYLLLAEPQLADAGAKALWCHPNRRGLPTTYGLSSTYYSTLPSDLVQALGALYADDMLLFGYSMHDYMRQLSSQ